MKRLLKYFLRILVLLIVLINAVILISGKTYIYKGLMHTYFKGRTGPGIFDQDLFASKVIRNDLPQPWPIHSQFNEGNYSPELDSGLIKVRSTALLVAQNDSLRYEKYWDDVEQSTISNSFSVAKTIVGILIGVAIDEGKIKSMDQPVGDFLPTYRSGGKEEITIAHVLMMASGLDWHESGGNPFSDNAEGYYGTDLLSQVERLEVQKKPGKEFEYQGGNTLILAQIIKRATGKSVSEYAEEKLWQPLGAESNALWNLDKEGGDEKAFCCFYATARDFLRLGKLYRNGGMWEGRQIVPEQYVSTTTSPANLTVNGKPTQRYGYHWWTDNYRNLDFYYARGIYGQYIIVIPEKALVVFRAGHLRDYRNERGHPVDIYLYIDAALEITEG